MNFFFVIRTQALLKELKVILDGHFIVVVAECLLCGAVLVSHTAVCISHNRMCSPS